MYILLLLSFCFTRILESANEMYFLLLNLKEQQKSEDRRLPFLNISSSSRVMTV